MKFQGRFRRRALTAACKIERDTIGNVRERSSNGVMDKGSRKVQKASTHGSTLSTYSGLPKREGERERERERETSGKVSEFIQRGDGRRFRERSEGELLHSVHARTKQDILSQ